MANTKISGLTEDTAPHRNNDFLASYDASAVQTKKVKLKNVGVIVLTGGIATSFSPADATTYFFGVWENAAPNTVGGFRRIYIQRAGIVTACHVTIAGAGTGTAETSTMSLRLNNTSDSTISSSIVTNGSIQVFSNTSMSISVAIGDYLEFKWVTPTWATNPTGLVVRGSVLQE
jgi:hypothetical protein